MLGKIIIALVLLGSFLEAKVTASVQSQRVIEGDSVELSIEAEGENVIFPYITEIEGVAIEATGSKQNITNINGSLSVKKTQTYLFSPTQNMTIPAFKVVVNGKDEYTDEIKLTVLKDQNLEQNFKLVISGNTLGYENYPIPVSIKFYRKLNQDIHDVKLQLSKGDYEFKQIGNEKTEFDGLYKVKSVDFFLIPKKSGKIEISADASIGFRKVMRDGFGFSRTTVKYKKMSAKKELTIKPLNENFVGDFSIKLRVDKSRVKAGDPVNAKLIIEGEGLLDDLDDIKVDIKGATLYDNKPKVMTSINNNKPYSIYTKEMVILSDTSYEIPPVSLSFYSMKEKKTKTVKTVPIPIEVYGKPASTTLAQSGQNAKQSDCPSTSQSKKTTFSWLYVIIALVVGYLLGFITLLFLKREKKEPLPNNLYRKLLPFADEKEIKAILEKLDKKERLSDVEKETAKKRLS